MLKPRTIRRVIYRIFVWVVILKNSVCCESAVGGSRGIRTNIITFCIKSRIVYTMAFSAIGTLGIILSQTEWFGKAEYRNVLKLE